VSDRIHLPYSSKVELFRNPKNSGPLEDATVVATAGSPACGDMIRLYLKIEEEGGKDIIEKITFESYGCAANIAAASMLTELVKGKSLEEAWRISWKVIADQLGGLPPIKYHCSILAVGAIDAGAKIVHGVQVDDLIFRDKPLKVIGVVIQWSAVVLSELHIDPFDLLFVESKAVIDAAGHDAEVVSIAVKRSRTST